MLGVTTSLLDRREVFFVGGREFFSVINRCRFQTAEDCYVEIE